MNLVLQHDHAKLWIWPYRLLPGFWFFGLVSGIAFYSSATPFSASWMRGVTSVSIVGFLVSAFLPFLISAFAVMISKPWLLAAVCFIKAFLFSFVSMHVMASWGEGGWLFQRLFMFHEICCVPILYTFWRRCLALQRLPGLTESVWWISVVVLIVGMNYRVVSPFCYGLAIL